MGLHDEVSNIDYVIKQTDGEPQLFWLHYFRRWLRSEFLSTFLAFFGVSQSTPEGSWAFGSFNLRRMRFFRFDFFLFTFARKRKTTGGIFSAYKNDHCNKNNSFKFCKICFNILNFFRCILIPCKLEHKLFVYVWFKPLKQIITD